LDWEAEHVRWLKPFLDRLGHEARRRMCPLNVTGVDWPRRPQDDGGAPGNYHQLHPSVAAGVWDATSLETELLI
jgi:hypothetical protein